ncbi:hypothetical protein CFO_g67 [Ceratocystis platani]|uniref:Uncharacterized protein n=1 Tax=Ceratocystis fimbriata f. sp. platani TaxID=88771 RepID=A0A0F8B996_CERFI|nr:hypothetical protein CFO_g67 [Ceratocystis platani]
MPEASLSSLTKPLYNSWQPASDDEAPPGGGLRIVVFGTPDIATAINGASGKQEKSWTEKLCEEHAIDTATNSKIDLSVPGYDYTFIKEQYPMPKHPDLLDQVTSFVSSPQPSTNPKDTLWVFNFGTWDIWYLSALPRDLATHYIDSLVIRIFSQLDFLYQESLNERSIAFSDFWHYSSQELVDKTRNSYADWEPQEIENFRVLLPQLFDISVSPGWNEVRPAPPEPHSKAEQDRNALFLTNRWNEMIAQHISEWNAKEVPTSDQEYDHIVEQKSYADFAKATEAEAKAKQEKEKKAKEKKEKEKKEKEKKEKEKKEKEQEEKEKKQGEKQNKRSVLSARQTNGHTLESVHAELTERSAEQLEKQAAAASSLRNRQNRVHKRWHHSIHGSSADETIVAPFPRRAAAQFDGQVFISEAIIEQQFRVRNISDHLGRGVRPDTDLAVFDNVNKPCVTGETSPLNQKVCSNPDNYLFYTLFTVNQPAINVIANRASVIVYDTLLLPKPGTVDAAAEEDRNSEVATKAVERTDSPGSTAKSRMG